MAGHTITDFIAKVRKSDFARTNRYEIRFNAPGFMAGEYSTDVISLLVEDGVFPGLLVGTRPLRINNFSEQRANAVDFGGDAITFTFLVDTEWTARDFFGHWIKNIVNPVSRYVAYPSDYYSEIELLSLDNNDEILARWQITDAFPRSVAPIQISATNSEVLRMPVTFAYTKWRSLNVAGKTALSVEDSDPPFGIAFNSSGFGVNFETDDTIDIPEFNDI
jgi:hypothetical protein